MSKQNYADFSDAYNALIKIGKNADSITAKALNKAGEIGEQELAKRTPYWDGKKYSRKDQMYKREHMQKNTAMTKATKGKHEVLIGYNDQVSWRVHFTELGTMTQRPQHFIEKTIKEVQDEIEKVIIKAMEEAFLK